MRISDWSSDVCSSDLNPLIDPADRRTRPTARLLDVGLASGDNRNIGCTAAHRRRFGGRIMASRAQPSLWRESVKAGAARSGALFAAIGIALVTLAIALALATYNRSEEHTSELQSLMRISYAVFCLKKKKSKIIPH